MRMQLIHFIDRYVSGSKPRSPMGSERIPLLFGGGEGIRKEQIQRSTHREFTQICELINAEHDDTKGHEYLSILMKNDNQELTELACQEFQNHFAPKVLAIVQTNMRVAKIVEQKFKIQISTIFSDIMKIYRSCTERINRTTGEQKPDEHLRFVKMEILILLNLSLSMAQDSDDLVTSLIDSPLFDYGDDNDTREPDYLSLFATIVYRSNNKLHAKVHSKLTKILEDLPNLAIETLKCPKHRVQILALLHAIVKECFEVFTEESCKLLQLVMEFIIVALRRTENNTDAFHVLYGIVDKIKTTEYNNYFYNTFFLKIVRGILKVLMGTNDQPVLYLTVLKHLCDGVGQITEHIWDMPLVPEYNTMIIKDRVMKFMNITFPKITASEVGAFVDELLNSSNGDDTINDLISILKRVRESSVVSREQVDPGEASMEEALKLRTSQPTRLSLGTTSREQMPSSKMASVVSAFSSSLPSLIDPSLVEWFQEDFLPGFTNTEELAFYKREVHSMWKNGSKVLQINFSDLLSHDPEKAIEICNCYERIEEELKSAARDFVSSEWDEHQSPFPTDMKCDSFHKFYPNSWQ